LNLLEEMLYIFEFNFDKSAKTKNIFNIITYMLS